MNQNLPPDSPFNVMPRRDFLRQMAVASAAAGAGVAADGFAAGTNAPGDAASTAAPARDLFVGIQMGSHTMLDEGLDHCLELIQQTAGVNALFLYSHAYAGDLRKGPQVLAQDHGGPPRDNRNRSFPMVWVRQHEQYFKDTSLRNQVPDKSLEYWDRDIFAELAEPARKRGIKLYARVLESTGPAMVRAIANFSKVVTVDVYGHPTTVACWNHPEYKAFWADTVEDLFRSYDLDGFQWGAERMGPLMNVILPWNDTPPTCFCEFCRTRGKSHGIDPERARQGFQNLYEYVRGLMAGSVKPADGVFVGFVRILLRYPEILAWEYQYRLSREEMLQGMYTRAKSIKPSAQIGWHVDHQPSSWDLIYRAEMSYAEMAPYSDFIKIIVYHNVLGPRIRNWYLERFKRTILSELSLESSLNLYYDLFGYDKAVEPTVDRLATAGFSPDYVYRETKRSVASAAGKVKIYPGIGFDVPGSPVDEPEKIRQAVLKAFDAGAAGIVVSREYEEMRVPNLKAVGEAVRELARRGTG